MLSTAAVRRKSGKTTDADGFEVPGWQTIATTPMRLAGSSSGDAGSRGAVIGGVAFETATGFAHLPHDSAIADDDLLEITAGEWAGTVWRVVKATAADQKTSRRVPVEGVARPTEWGA